MSVTPELIKSKLSSVDQSSDTIVSVSSWLLFHRRSAPTIVNVWLQAVKDGSSNRKLSLLYLANEVSQQSRAKKRPEYLSAFSKVMPEAVENVFRHATTDVQAKIVRVIDVWKQRSIFSPDVLEEMSGRISSSGKQQRPQSSNSNGLPHELTGLAEQYTRLFGMTSSSSLALGTANSLYGSLMDNDTKPSPDLYIAKLRQLGSSLALASTTVQNSVKLREEIDTQLRALMEANTSALNKDKQTLAEILEKQEKVKADTGNADQIMSDLQQPGRSTTPEMEPPVAEAITPLTGPEDSDMPVDPFKLEQEPAEQLQGPALQDPVAKLQMELHPSITELLARQSNGTTGGTQSQAQDEEIYIP